LLLFSGKTPRCISSKTTRASVLRSKKALEEADRGEFIDEEEMDARVKAMLGSRN
jgi:hypothetical protein